MNENHLPKPNTAPPIPPKTFTPVPPKAKKRDYNTVEMVFAWVCILFGYLLCRVFPVTESPMGGLIFTVLLYAVSTVILKIRGAKFPAMAVILALTAVIMQAALIISANPYIHFFAFVYGLAVYLYYVYSAFGNNIEKGFSNYVTADFLKAAFVMPFECLGNVFSAITDSIGKKNGKSLLRILLGIVLAAIPTAIIVSLLSYDKGFSDIMDRLFAFDFNEIISHVGSIIFGIPIAMYAYGLFISSVDKNKPDSLSREKCRNFLEKLKIAPVVTVCIAVVPVISVYIIFFVSQWQYYVSGFSGVLPESLSYAEYAREGFFQLCTVSFINFFIIAAIGIFMKRNGKGTGILMKIISLVFSLFTLVLIATAMAKMYMYIDCYGLTPRRVYASWGMLVLAFMFLLIIVKQFARRLKLIAAMLLTVVVLFVALALSGVDSYIAEYNVSRYIDGTLKDVDVDAILDLGDAGIEQLARLAKHLDAENGTDIAAVKPEDLHTKDLYTRLVLGLRFLYCPDGNFFSYTIPHAKALAALEELGMERWGEDDYIKLPFTLRPY